MQGRNYQKAAEVQFWPHLIWNPSIRKKNLQVKNFTSQFLKCYFSVIFQLLFDNLVNVIRKLQFFKFYKKVQYIIVPVRILRKKSQQFW